MNYPLALCSILFAAICTLPDVSAQSIKEVDRLIGSPEAAEFAKYGNLDVSLYKGVPNITVPIYTLELKDFSLPVYLSYDAGGVKVDQIATSVGLGWSLHAGGQISAMTHALSDVDHPYEEPANLETFDPNLWDTGGSTTEENDYKFAWEMFESPFAGDPKNTKPDVFYFNYPGNSGKFVKKSLATFSSVPYTNHTVSLTNGLFEIIDEHGNLFKFEQKETTTTTLRNCNGGPGSISAGSPVNSGMIPDESYTWHLSEIVTTNGDVIEFEYQVLSGYSYDAQIVQQKYKAQGGNHMLCETYISDYQCTVEKYVTPTVLKKIIHQRSGTEIRFSYLTGRSDFGGEELNRIQIIKNTDSGIHTFEEFNLNQSYFQSSGGTDHRYKRLRLDSVTKSGYGSYSFTYDNSVFPHRGSYSQDTWGFYNGQSNSTLVPNGNGLTGAANRNVYTSYVDHWTMTEIQWPTGGKTILDMEADPQGGGLRVASIHDLDGLGNTVGKRDYSYQRETFLTPLYLDYYSYYVEDPDTQTPVYYQCHYDMYTASSVQPVSTIDGPDYGYSQVTMDYDDNGEQGRSIVNYATELSDLTGSPGYVGPLAWGRGEQTSETHYKYNGIGYSPVQKTVQTYSVRFNASGSMWSNPTHNHEYYIYGMDIQLSNPEYRDTYGQLVMPARFEVTKYRINSAWYHPDETISYIYDPDDDTQYVRTEVKKIFDTSSTRLTSMIEENSDGQVRSRQFTYGVAGKPSKLTLLTVKNGSGEVIRKRWANWSASLGSGRQELHQIWDWTHGDPYQSPSASNAILAQEVTSYDAYGNPKTLLDANGYRTIYYYGSNSNPLSYTSLHGTDGVYLTGVRKDTIGGSFATTLISKATYDAYGRLTSILDHNDNTTTFGWDSLHRLEEVRNDNNELVEAYDYIKSYLGGTYDETYSNYIQTLRYDGAQTRTSRAYVDGLGRPIQSQMQGDGHTIISAMEYDGQGRPWKSYKPYPKVGSIGYHSGYDGAAQTEYGTDPFVESLYEASPLGRPEETIPEGGATASGSVATDYEVRTWNNNKWMVTTTTDEIGNLAENWADGWGRTIRTIADPGGLQIQTQFDYDELDQLTKVYHPNHFTESGDWTTEYVYDKRGRLTQKTSIDAGTTRYLYDPAGNLRFIQDAVHAAASDVVFRRYDFAGRLIEEGVGNIGATNFENLDAAGTESFESDQTNLIGFYQYDLKPDHNNFPWNQFSDQITSVNITNRDGNLNGRAWRFNNYGAPENVNLNGLGITEDETYLATISITAENTVVSSGSELVLSAGETVTLKPGFEVELGAVLTANIDETILSGGLSGISSLTGSNNWQVELFSYDEENRVSDKWIWTGNRREWDTHLGYAYNRLGEVTRMMVEVGTETLYQHYEYNLLGQLHKVFISTTGSYDPVNDDPEVTYTYTPSGAIDLIVYEGGKQADYEYTIRDWVESINSIGSPAGSFAALYEYENNGNISMSRFYNPDIDISSTHRDYRYAYTYDDVNRLMGGNYSFGSSGTGSTLFDVEGLSYDDNGNILSVLRRDETGATFDNVTYNYGSNNRLSSVSDNATTHHGWDAYTSSFTYDANGNMKSQSGKLTDIAYEHRNLPIHFYLEGGAEVIANYNADGQRIVKESSGGAWTFYVMDGMQTLAVITQDGLSHLNLVGSGTFGRIEANTSGAITTTNTRYYNITDHLGSTREVVNNSGSMVETFDYYPFGLLMPGRNGGTNLTLEKFTGKERDTESGLNLDYFGARYYDPAISRFAGVDPLEDEYPNWSPYNYTLNNPIRYTDPDGQCPVAGNLFCIGMQQGFEQSLTSTFEGIKGLFTDFSGTMSALGHAVSNPGETLSAIGEGISERVDMATSGNPLLMGQVAGEAVAMTGEVLLGAKGVGAATKTARGLKAADNVTSTGDLGRVFHYTSASNAESISTTGIRSSRGTVYATPNNSLSPLQAQIDLALSPNRGLPGAVFEINAGGLRQAGISVSQPQQVGRMFNMPGGGQEVLIRGNVPPEFIRRIR